MNDPELKAMSQLADAMAMIEDDETRVRVLQWAVSKYLPQANQSKIPEVRLATERTTPIAPVGPAASIQNISIPPHLNEIVEVDDDGQIRIIARDLKAKSRNDAAIRLAHLVIFANETLKNEKEVSSKQILLPVLRDWRAYDANTRVALARHPGIKRNGDLLSLDLHSKREAQKYITEILDESVKGSWSNGQTRKKRKRDTSSDTPND